ncbi:MAG: GlxA family transcriptional regulator [Rhodobacteraceae bacterium]|nr:GlxA family transcriptional regulator [Paracoccaceae bacterium]
MQESRSANEGSAGRMGGFTFVLLDSFTLLSFAGAVEVLRLANRASGATPYRWQILSVSGDPVQSSVGTVFQPDGGLCALPPGETIILCGGLDIVHTATPPLLNWLRREARRGARVGALCTASYVLARAGLLDGRPATIHWENHAAMAEDFPDIDLRKSVYVLDGPRFTAAGGTAAIDLMLRLVAQDQGESLAAEVADQVIHPSIRSDQDTQRLSIPTRIGVRHAKLSQVIERMEANIEEPISPQVLARDAGLSTRQLERLFRRYLNRSPKRYYMDLRLQRARTLLLQTNMTVINVALACGFTSPSHFSKCYQAQYRVTPYRERGTRRDAAPAQPEGAGESR